MSAHHRPSDTHMRRFMPQRCCGRRCLLARRDYDADIFADLRARCALMSFHMHCTPATAWRHRRPLPLPPRQRIARCRVMLLIAGLRRHDATPFCHAMHALFTRLRGAHMLRLQRDIMRADAILRHARAHAIAIHHYFPSTRPYGEQSATPPRHDAQPQCGDE